VPLPASRVRSIHSMRPTIDRRDVLTAETRIPRQAQTTIDEAVFVHGSQDVRVAPINLREGRLDESLIASRRLGYAGVTCTTTGWRHRLRHHL
jgi:hypothetical protein